MHWLILCFYAAACPKLEAPLNGRKLGKVLLKGHEVHFLCDSGYELVGSETRQCKESLTWSGQQPVCKGQSYTRGVKMNIGVVSVLTLIRR